MWVGEERLANHLSEGSEWVYLPTLFYLIDIGPIMLLAIDIGNTHTVLGLYSNDQMFGHWRISSLITRTEDECWILLRLFCEYSKMPFEQIDGVAISSVVPNLTPMFQQMAEKHLKIVPIVISSQIDLGIKILYDDPNAVGADRICNAIAGFTKYGGPLVVVDFGTATTFDVIAKNGDYLGGVIFPGIETSAMNLHRRAAKLPKVELKFPSKVIGTNTEASMQSGILFGAVDQVDGMVKRISDEFGEKVNYIATGGLAPLIVGHSKYLSIIEPFLILDGLRLIHSRLTVLK
jgi:type III pantothenate kinase